MQFKTVSRFDKEVKELAKKYSHIKSDLQNLIANFDKNHQTAKKIKANTYKIRIKNSDKAKGKSAGYRTYYYAVEGEIISSEIK
jgi:mRNA-degrading endonuclease RelE of RelBE toxin-antitoxin system